MGEKVSWSEGTAAEKWDSVCVCVCGGGVTEGRAL